ncbi:hypothetical protein [Alteromonas facilis]|uniref:hypothetical protein n=1 Tax=Alteromonas facilis TaxID=2048004 RepID=UPI000C2862A5|nr:hypothetical protein [Alteromonas facilis]
MSKDYQSELFSAWLDDRLSHEQRQEFEALCISDAAFSARVANANHIKIVSDAYHPEEVPAWNREATFDMPQSLPWWQSPKLALSSFACSAFAIVLALSNVQVSVTDDGVNVGFAERVTNAQIDALVAQRIQDYQDNNQAMFAQYVDALNRQQQESSVQLTEYLLSSSRQERREDFAELVKFLNEQRSDDQLFYARQLNNLQQEIYAQNGIRANVPTINADQSQLPNE